MKTLFLSSTFSEVTDKFKECVSITNNMKAAFITTAADTYESKPWMYADRQALVDLGIEVEDCDIKNKTEEKLYDLLKSKDIIFVSGGNTFYLLYHTNQSGLGKVLAMLLDQGKIYIGSSAGSVLIGPTIEPVKTFDNPNDAPNLKSFEGLSFINFVILPHYGKEKYEQKYQDILKEWSNKVNIQLLRDNEVIFVKDGDFKLL